MEEGWTFGTKAPSDDTKMKTRATVSSRESNLSGERTQKCQREQQLPLLPYNMIGTPQSTYVHPYVLMTQCRTLRWLPRVHHWLKGGTGDVVGLLGGSGLGYLLPEGLGEATLQELPACSELLIVLRILRAVTTAFIKDRYHSRLTPTSL